MEFLLDKHKQFAILSIKVLPKSKYLRLGGQEL